MNMVISIKTKETVVCNVNIQNTKIQVTQVAVPVLPIPFPTICKMDNICIPAVCELKRMDSSQGYLGGGGVTYLCKYGKEMLRCFL